MNQLHRTLGFFFLTPLFLHATPEDSLGKKDTKEEEVQPSTTLSEEGDHEEESEEAYTLSRSQIVILTSTTLLLTLAIATCIINIIVSQAAFPLLFIIKPKLKKESERNMKTSTHVISTLQYKNGPTTLYATLRRFTKKKWGDEVLQYQEISQATDKSKTALLVHFTGNAETIALHYNNQTLEAIAHSFLNNHNEKYTDVIVVTLSRHIYGCAETEGIKGEIQRSLDSIFHTEQLLIEDIKAGVKAVKTYNHGQFDGFDFYLSGTSMGCTQALICSEQCVEEGFNVKNIDLFVPFWRLTDVMHGYYLHPITWAMTWDIQSDQAAKGLVEALERKKKTDYPTLSIHTTSQDWLLSSLGKKEDGDRGAIKLFEYLKGLYEEQNLKIHLVSHTFPPQTAKKRDPHNLVCPREIERRYIHYKYPETEVTQEITREEHPAIWDDSI